MTTIEHTISAQGISFGVTVKARDRVLVMYPVTSIVFAGDYPEQEITATVRRETGCDRAAFRGVDGSYVEAGRAVEVWNFSQ